MRGRIVFDSIRYASACRTRSRASFDLFTVEPLVLQEPEGKVTGGVGIGQALDQPDTIEHDFGLSQRDLDPGDDVVLVRRLCPSVNETARTTERNGWL